MIEISARDCSPNIAINECYGLELLRDAATYMQKLIYSCSYYKRSVRRLKMTPEIVLRVAQILSAID